MIALVALQHTFHLFQCISKCLRKLMNYKPENRQKLYIRNSQSDPIWSKIDPLRAQIDPLWSQTRGTLARLQKQNTNKMSYSLEKSKKAVSLLRVVSSPEQYVCFFNFNFGLFSYLLSFSYRFYLPYFLDLANCVSDQAEFCSREGMRAIVKKYLSCPQE